MPSIYVIRKIRNPVKQDAGPLVEAHHWWLGVIIQQPSTLE